MHVGVVTFGDPDYGLDLANALHTEQASVSLYLSKAAACGAAGDAERPAEALYERGLLDREIGLRLFQLPRMRDPRSLSIVRSIARSMHEDGVDIAHIINGAGELWTAVLACMVRGIPVISTMKEVVANVGGYPSPRMVKLINRILVHGSDAIVVNGNEHVSMVQELYGVPPQRVHFVPLGPRATAVRWIQRRVPEEPGTILFFGGVRHHKGLEYLVRAQPLITEQVPHARIVIAGRGVDLERCRAMIQDASRFEIYDRFVPGDVAAEYFQKCSLVVLPYISASTSGVLMTAYLFGKPVVVTRVGCLPDYVQDGVTGLLISPRSEGELADAIVHLLCDTELRHRMGENAETWANNAIRDMAIESIGVYEKTISECQNKKWFARRVGEPLEGTRRNLA